MEHNDTEESIPGRSNYGTTILYLMYIAFLEYVFINDVSMNFILLSGLFSFLFLFSLSSNMKKNKNLKNFYKELANEEKKLGMDIKDLEKEKRIIAKKNQTETKSKAIYVSLAVLSLLTLGLVKFHKLYFPDENSAFIMMIKQLRKNITEFWDSKLNRIGFYFFNTFSILIVILMILTVMKNSSLDLEIIYPFIFCIIMSVLQLFLISIFTVLFFIISIPFSVVKDLLTMQGKFYVEKIVDDIDISKMKIDMSTIDNLYKKYNIKNDTHNSIKGAIFSNFLFAIPFIIILFLMTNYTDGFAMNNLIINDLDYSSLFNKTTEIWSDVKLKGILDILGLIIFTPLALIHDIVALPFLLIYNLLIIIVASSISLILVSFVIISFYAPILSGLIVKAETKHTISTFVQTYFYVSYLTILFFIAFL